MNTEELQKNKAHYLQLCREYIHRDGLEDLLAYLEKSDFFEAPSSTSFHLNEEGGLCKHTINVFETALALNQYITTPAIESGESMFSKPLKAESIAIATLFHDLCKVKLYHKKEKWKKDENNRWLSYPGYEIEDEFPLGHGEKSCLIVSWYMKLTAEEMLAIRWHMGMFDMGENGSSMRYSFRAALEKSPLVSLLIAADMLSANQKEKTTTY